MMRKDVEEKVNELIRSADKKLCAWLNTYLPKLTDDWWNGCVLSSLSDGQRQKAEQNGVVTLERLDTNMLLRVAERNWYAISVCCPMPQAGLDAIRGMKIVAGRWVYPAGKFPAVSSVTGDLNLILKFFEGFGGTLAECDEIGRFISELGRYGTDGDSYGSGFASDAVEMSVDGSGSEASSEDGGTFAKKGAEIKEKDLVCLKSDPKVTGVVLSVRHLENVTVYDVFVNGAVEQFYENQIILSNSAGKGAEWTKLCDFQNYLTTYQINNPSSSNLYSLNSARIDFVSYQFRPALKLIKSDRPRILIADSVGVGKTIEAGLIIKELEARQELERILIVCPKPLVVERKWELEMKRFDEEFVPLDGAALKRALTDCDLEGEWPSRYGRCIVPYSILNKEAYEGGGKKSRSNKGLSGLDPKPRFDLVIVDEAHHIRNGSMTKDKHYSYKCVREFCDSAAAVVMLTATPLQTSDNDLFTLLNVVRPDIVIDKSTFDVMSKPNAYVSRCSGILRSAADTWREDALSELTKLKNETEWGRSVIGTSALYQRIVEKLKEENLSGEDRVALIDDVESLHSFNNIMNRTRRKDIENFCVRHTTTLEVSFTPAQKELHDKLIEFEAEVFLSTHIEGNVNFYLSMIRRQAASCIFGLAPCLNDIISHQFGKFADDEDADDGDGDTEEYVAKAGEIPQCVLDLAKKILDMAKNLPDEDDPKFGRVLEVVEKKQEEDNNKIIIFSTFRHTLDYVEKKLKNAGTYRVAQINGSIDDEERVSLRNRFSMDKSEKDALDILLFTEVGAEGLDYQFCNMMINYDLPWNPMRIEQRIGRIDRHGQTSEVVNIYNAITSGTVDADIYERCLWRIGVFEHSIGECDAILGNICKEIEKIGMNFTLSEEERIRRLSDLADNEIKRARDMERLEDEQKSLFGFDLSSYLDPKQISDADNPWLSQGRIIRLVQKYLNDRLDDGQSASPRIIGSGDRKTLRLSADKRRILREDFKLLQGPKTKVKTEWDKYLKGMKPDLSVTFDADYAKAHTEVQFITITHPLVRQASMYFRRFKPLYVRFGCNCDEISSGVYPFEIYLWKYIGFDDRTKLRFICDDKQIAEEWNDLILNFCDDLSDDNAYDENMWDSLENRHHEAWAEEKERHVESVKEIADIRIKGLTNSYLSQNRPAEERLNHEKDDKIRKMLLAQIENNNRMLGEKTEEVTRRVEKADIEFTLIVKGYLVV